MKHLIIVFFIFCSACAGAQSLPNFNLIKLENPSDYKTAEPFVLQTATYLLSVPYMKDNKDRLGALQFMRKWMNGTTDYSFAFGESERKMFSDNYDIFGIYMAALAKYTLENKDIAKDVKVAKLNAMKTMLNYCENKDNNIRMSKQLKKLSEAKAKGQLEQLL
jgi:hypothetical protein